LSLYRPLFLRYSFLCVPRLRSTFPFSAVVLLRSLPLLRPVILCFLFYVSRFMFCCSYLSDWISMVSVCVGLWIWNVCVWYCVYGSGVSSLVSACVNPRGSLSSPRVVSVVVSSCSPLSPPVVVFSFVISSSLFPSSFVPFVVAPPWSRLLVVFLFVTPVTFGSGSQPSLGLRPSTFGSSSVVLVV
jgi:hypothetical protein